MKLLILDNSTNDSLTRWWRIGARLFARHFDDVIYALSYRGLLEALEKRAQEGEKYDEIQYWGHGTPGEVYLGGTPITYHFVEALAKVVSGPKAVVWFRVCSYAAGEAGQRLMQRDSRALGCRLAAFTHIIGSWGFQSGLHVIEADGAPAWPKTEGIAATGKGLQSAPWLPRSVPAIAMSLPSWAFDGK
jgi:hypothetical protein